jgi:hypothetical protein
VVITSCVASHTVSCLCAVLQGQVGIRPAGPWLRSLLLPCGGEGGGSNWGGQRAGGKALLRCTRLAAKTVVLLAVMCWKFPHAAKSSTHATKLKLGAVVRLELSTLLKHPGSVPCCVSLSLWLLRSVKMLLLLCTHVTCSTMRCARMPLLLRCCVLLLRIVGTSHCSSPWHALLNTLTKVGATCLCFCLCPLLAAPRAADECYNCSGAASCYRRLWV